MGFNQAFKVLKSAEYLNTKYTEDWSVNIVKVTKALNQTVNQKLKRQQNLQQN